MGPWRRHQCRCSHHYGHCHRRRRSRSSCTHKRSLALRTNCSNSRTTVRSSCPRTLRQSSAHSLRLVSESARTSEKALVLARYSEPLIRANLRRIRNTSRWKRIRVRRSFHTRLGDRCTPRSRRRMGPWRHHQYHCSHHYGHRRRHTSIRRSCSRKRSRAPHTGCSNSRTTVRSNCPRMLRQPLAHASRLVSESARTSETALVLQRHSELLNRANLRRIRSTSRSKRSRCRRSSHTRLNDPRKMRSCKEGRRCRKRRCQCRCSHHYGHRRRRRCRPLRGRRRSRSSRTHTRSLALRTGCSNSRTAVRSNCPRTRLRTRSRHRRTRSRLRHRTSIRRSCSHKRSRAPHTGCSSSRTTVRSNCPRTLQQSLAHAPRSAPALSENASARPTRSASLSLVPLRRKRNTSPST